MTRLTCPRCATTFEPPAGTTPVCPSCGYTTASPPAPAYPGAAPAYQPMPPPTYAAQPGYPVGYAPPKASGASIAALVLGLVGFCTIGIPFIGVFIMLVVAVLAIIFGVQGIRAANAEPYRVGGKGMAIAGLVLGIILGTFGLIGLFFVFAIFGSLDPDQWDLLAPALMSWL